jgi:hypothetical protein
VRAGRSAAAGSRVQLRTHFETFSVCVRRYKLLSWFAEQPENQIALFKN